MTRYRPCVVYKLDDTEGIYYGVSLPSKKAARGEAIRAALRVEALGGEPTWVGCRRVS